MMDGLFDLSQRVITLCLEAGDLCRYEISDDWAVDRINRLAADSREILQQAGDFAWFQRAHTQLNGSDDPLAGDAPSYHDLAFYRVDGFLARMLIHSGRSTSGVVPSEITSIDPEAVEAITDEYRDDLADLVDLEPLLRREAACAVNLIKQESSHPQKTDDAGDNGSGTYAARFVCPPCPECGGKAKVERTYKTGLRRCRCENGHRFKKSSTP